mgnify:CR=1 FL=1
MVIESKINDVVSQLKTLGYPAKPTKDGVTSFITDVHSVQHGILITQTEDGEFQLDCQICTLGDLEKKHTDEKETLSLAWVLLSINSSIQPWSVALINPDNQLDPSDVLVLTTKVKDFENNSVLEEMIGALEQAMVHVSSVLN